MVWRRLLVILQACICIINRKSRVIDSVVSALPDAILLKHLLAIDDKSSNPKFKSKFVSVNIFAWCFVCLERLDTSQKSPAAINKSILANSDYIVFIILRVLVLVPLLSLWKEDKRPHLFGCECVSANIKTSILFGFCDARLKFLNCP